jgi:hypothetical protein
VLVGDDVGEIDEECGCNIGGIVGANVGADDVTFFLQIGK